MEMEPTTPDGKHWKGGGEGERDESPLDPLEDAAGGLPYESILGL